MNAPLPQSRSTQLLRFGHDAVAAMGAFALAGRGAVAGVDAAVELFTRVANAAVAGEGGLALQLCDSGCYVNGRTVAFEVADGPGVHALLGALTIHDIGGLNVNAGIQAEEVRAFAALLAEPDAGGRQEFETRWQTLKFSDVEFNRVQVRQRLRDQLAEGEGEDPSKRSMEVYARAVRFVRICHRRFRQQQQLPSLMQAGRASLDLVEAAERYPVQLLALSSSRNEDDYASHHSVNTCLLALLLGREIGLERRHLHELGTAALLFDVGIAEVPPQVIDGERGLSAEERQLVDLYPLHTVRALLRGRFVDRAVLKYMAAAYESHVDYSVPMVDRSGEVKLMLPKIELGVYGKVIAICATYDALTSSRPFRAAFSSEMAAMLMLGDMRYKFDPHLLRVFLAMSGIRLPGGASVAS